MGSLVGWRCGDCGAGEDFIIGTGARCLTDSDIAAIREQGAFGPAIPKLFENGIPEGCYVFEENVYYRCPECGGIATGKALRVLDDEGTGWLVFHAEPEPCSTCGERLYFWSDKVPLSQRELVERCGEYAVRGCPHCGGSNISAKAGDWD